ncbi:MAG TPA: sulfatase/phosphatase domain-containing protein, partial [bacterium]|nr:sulfatase/phosphatase domain-containing protein [bacterium]
KSSVYEGGIRSPFWMRWPARLSAGQKSDRIAAHIDILPTVLEACDVPIPRDIRIDGESLLPLLEGDDASWPDRHIVIQAHRGNEPVRYHNFMIRNQQWKLLHPSGFGTETFQGDPEFELYDMANDPLEMQDLAEQRPEIVADLRERYEQWFRDVSTTRPDNYAPPRIHIGTPHENPTVLTRQDWRHVKGRPWGADSNGFWMLYAANSGEYDIRLRFHNPMPATGEAELELGEQTHSQPFSEGQSELVFEQVPIEQGDLNLQATLHLPETTRGPWQVDVMKP